MTPYYADDAVTIYHGDMMEFAHPPTIDLIVTSPPYNLGAGPWPHLGHWKRGDSAGSKAKWRGGLDGGTGAQYETHGDTMPWEQYVAWQQDVLRHLWTMLSPTGAIFYNHKPRVIGERLWTPQELNPGLPLRQIVVWARAGGMNYTTTAYVPTHEWIMVLAMGAFRLKSKGASGLGDVWSIAQERSEHPAPFPIGLPSRAIETTSPSLVLDPFMGSGTTLLAAKNAGVRSIGVDISERYCEMAAKRLGQEVLAL